ncbi:MULTISPECIES: superoxide dismutase [unclassified Streptomyces]|uniref:SMP-30/gluconolactonase/LRE family protein n=1 Tax=unclassified Streptomyces TaxID=2593676 RepID=UPI002DD90718|nr:MULTISPECIES: superoxide dismutase [unclassified Streptomyces]WSA95217.1 superoxide dismutase [Streptomyces sp. NBC_01795]WSB79635.1 superoxide dismutase [Streptomyces sp. NBC_01775]WSS12162.1 superoxide dismutase [Streptomyces sp. NBC_01186]WSS40873.1 superoxide dismutase [Streptomyces sp. NBC_01187]
MLAAVTAATALTAFTAPPASHLRISTAYELPGDRVYPEGIGADPRSDRLYAASYENGAVYRMTPGHRVAETFLPPGADGRHTANGLKVDRAGRLWVTDSTSGVFVYDTRTRELLARFDVPRDAGKDTRDPAFVNDVTLTPDGSAYLTDSTRGVVYRVTSGQLAHVRAHGGRGELVPRFDLTGLLPEAPPGGKPSALNGIVAGPGGRYLLTADMIHGGLYRLDPATGEAERVALRGGDLRNADGLEAAGGKLWAVHNTDYALSRWRLDRDGTAAHLERRESDPALQLPTTVAREHGTLYVVRSQFDKGGPMGPGTPQTPFTVAAVRGL